MADRYRASGVNLAAGDEATARIRDILAGARGEEARGIVGAFGGMVRVPADVADPVLVLSTDGVGTKVLVAIRARRHDTIGEDLVNHCVNDILVHGARAIAFQDYIAAGTIDPAVIASLVEGVARGCRAHGMTLAGGETAEMPDLYAQGHYDLAGTIVGVVSEGDALHGERVTPGDVLVGLEASGLHTNGYSLARRIVFDEQGLDVDDRIPDLDDTAGNVLLTVHRSYAACLAPVLARLHGLAHITGGGLPGNVRRTLPAGCAARIDQTAWTPLPVFKYLEDAGRVEREEMFRVFNMGIGMVAILPPDAVAEVVAAARGAGIEAWPIGEVVPGDGVQIV